MFLCLQKYLKIIFLKDVLWVETVADAFCDASSKVEVVFLGIS